MSLSSRMTGRLHSLPRAEQREWAKNALAQLRPLLKAGDTIVMLAGLTYRRDLLNGLREHGVTVETPLEGLHIGEQLRWLTQANDQSNTAPVATAEVTAPDTDLERFYALIDVLDDKIGGAQELRSCTVNRPGFFGGWIA